MHRRSTLASSEPRICSKLSAQKFAARCGNQLGPVEQAQHACHGSARSSARPHMSVTAAQPDAWQALLSLHAAVPTHSICCWALPQARDISKGTLDITE